MERAFSEQSGWIRGGRCEWKERRVFIFERGTPCTS
uniref:Uncharacterized protein n=1 Tax=Anguilla anguilla TaxID=7936 RepID=A0A0E9PHU9_ANGAN